MEIYELIRLKIFFNIHRFNHFAATVETLGMRLKYCAFFFLFKGHVLKRRIAMRLYGNCARSVERNKNKNTGKLLPTELL